METKYSFLQNNFWVFNGLVYINIYIWVLVLHLLANIQYYILVYKDVNTRNHWVKYEQVKKCRNFVKVSKLK